MVCRLGLELVWKISGKAILGYLSCYYLWELYRGHYSFPRSLFIQSLDLSAPLIVRLITAGALWQKMVGGAHPTNVLDLSIQQERSGARCTVVFVKMQNLLLKVEIDIPWGSRNPERFHKTNLQ